MALSMMAISRRLRVPRVPHYHPIQGIFNNILNLNNKMNIIKIVTNVHNFYEIGD
jgi:hypothetical protein